MRSRISRSIVVLMVTSGAGSILDGLRGAEAAAPRSARICSSCHGEITKQWDQSAKSHSWRNPVFQAFLADAKATLGDAAQVGCLSCHAPLAAVTGDYRVEDPINQEGITCNFCHNVDAVEISPKPASYTWDATDPNLMRGPFKDAEPGTAHAFAYSESMTKSDFCAPCHWYGDEAAGLVFEGTYPYWRTSKAAAGGSRCQDCHMPPSAGKVALTAKKTRDRIWGHQFVGARTPGALDSVASLAAEVEQGKLKLTVRNNRAGHTLPGGGASMRAITLEVIFRDAAGAVVARVPVQTYDTEFADAAGKFPVPKWLAKKVVRSNEILPDVPKVEWAEIPESAKRAEVVLTYQPLLPVYRAALLAKQVDLSGRDPVVMTRAVVTLP